MASTVRGRAVRLLTHAHVAASAAQHHAHTLRTPKIEGLYLFLPSYLFCMILQPARGEKSQNVVVDGPVGHTSVHCDRGPRAWGSRECARLCVSQQFHSSCCQNSRVLSLARCRERRGVRAQRQTCGATIGVSCSSASTCSRYRASIASQSRSRRLASLSFAFLMALLIQF